MSKYLSAMTRMKPYTPKDYMEYVLPSTAIHDTETVLLEYAKIVPPNEGLVYWGGKQEGNRITVLMVIAPRTESDFGRVSVSNRSNFDFVRALSRNSFIQVAQVHSHPTDWVDHSQGDDKWAPFKIEGLVSIVVPDYCRNGMPPLTACGVHRYTNGNFIRLSGQYVRTHFRIIDSMSSAFEELRK